jgi:ribose transport system ATP-binding protein
MSVDALLKMLHIVKRYPGVTALDDVSLDLNGGEVLCLVGENGAGKSTLVNILAGALRNDAGAIHIGGVRADIRSPLEAQQLGVAVIFQDFKLVPGLSVAENIVLGSEPTVRFLPFINRRKVLQRARDALAQVGEGIDPSAPVSMLSVGERQMVEIARAISKKARLLAMDEPTASLSDHEIARLFKVIRRLRAEGVGIIYVSHRLKEVFEIGDRITVLRDGKVVQNCGRAGVDRAQLIRWMVGREIDQEYPKADLARGDAILRVEHLYAPGLQDVSFELFRGEILGFAGLVGAGRTQLARALFGAVPGSSGRVLFEGRPVAPRSPHHAIREGIGLLTEDRNRLGLVLQMSVRENISLSSLSEMKTGPFINLGAERALATRYVGELQVRPPYVDAPVEILSGGNRQKVVIARWLNTRARLLIFDEPTAGIDVGARYEIYRMINRLAASGVGVMLISSDLPELLGICDRIAIMCQGRITGVLARSEANQEKLMTLATTVHTR